MMFRFSSAVFMMALMSSQPSMASEQYPEKECKSIAEIACTTPDFEILCLGVKEAGLAETLSGPGNFTVFAPTNEAFKKLPDSIVALLDDVAVLKNILLYHTVLDVFLSSDLVCSGLVEMATGRDTRTRCEDDKLFQKGAGNSRDDMPEIIGADVLACNGVIHIVDEVILPRHEAPPTTSGPTSSPAHPTTSGPTSSPAHPTTSAPTSSPAQPTTSAPTSSPPTDAECKSIAEIACSTEDFSTLCSLVKQAGLADTLATDTFTVFAPTNEAFAKLPQEVTDAVTSDDDVLKNVLLYHTVAGKVVTPDDLICGELLTMTNGKQTRTLCNGERTFQNGAGNDKKVSPEIVGGDVKACNGLIYVIDGVILPK